MGGRCSVIHLRPQIRYQGGWIGRQDRAADGRGEERMDVTFFCGIGYRVYTLYTLYKTVLNCTCNEECDMITYTRGIAL